MNREQTASRAFTLIELLVVIAIISLLVSILLPSLNRAKDLARMSVCAANMRQFHIVSTFYMEEFDGHMPALLCDKDEGMSDNAMRIENRGIVHQLASWEADRPTERVDKPAWQVCPADRNPSNKDLSSWSPRSTSYAAFGIPLIVASKARNGADHTRRSASVDDIKDESGKFNASDVAMYAEAPDSSNWTIWFTLQPVANKYGQQFNWHFLFRHQKDEVMNLVFYDGHVSPSSIAEMDEMPCGTHSYWY